MINRKQSYNYRQDLIIGDVLKKTEKIVINSGVGVGEEMEALSFASSPCGGCPS